MVMWGSVIPVYTHQSGSCINCKRGTDPVYTHQSGSCINCKRGTDPVYTHQSGSCINCVYVFLFHLNSSEKFLSSISNTVDILLLKVSQI